MNLELVLIFYFFFENILCTHCLSWYFLFFCCSFPDYQIFHCIIVHQKKVTKRNSQTLNLSDRPKIPDLLIFQSCSLCCLLYFFFFWLTTTFIHRFICICIFMYIFLYKNSFFVVAIIIFDSVLVLLNLNYMISF